MSTTNKLAAISGGSKGIGLAIAELALEKGLHVAICARNRDKLFETTKKLQEKFPHQRVLSLAIDVSNKEDVKQFQALIKGSGLELDLIVNNAGVFVPGQVHNEEEGQFEKMLAVNLHSAYYFSKLLLPFLTEKKSGHLFSICSTASIIPYVNGGSYCISKFAMYGLTKVLREEMKEFGVKVTAILPGATLTASWDGVDLPSERFIRPIDVANALFNAYEMPKESVVEEILIRPFLGDI